MENLKIKGSKGAYYIPTVDFDAQTGVCILSGESFLEDTEEFYDKLMSWLIEYIKEIKGPIIFNFNLTYYNTSSSRAILAILKLLRSYRESGGIVDINWYLGEDKDLVEEIEDFMIETDVKINIIPPAHS